MIDERRVNEIKTEALDMCAKAGVGHVTSAFSCAEIVAVLYYEIMRIDPGSPGADHDYFVMSKNHASVITYPILKDLGFIDKSEEFLENGSHLGIHTKPGLNGVDFCGGSLGIGLGFAAGIAFGLKNDNKDDLVFCIVGDGECYEGSIWEALMFAGANRLNNLVVIVDKNRMCITDFTDDMLSLGSLKSKISSFDFDVKEIDGHDLGEIRKSLENVRDGSRTKPLCIIADTIKGHGVSFLENRLLWHGRAPVGDDYAKAREELLRNINGNK